VTPSRARTGPTWPWSFAYRPKGSRPSCGWSSATSRSTVPGAPRSCSPVSPATVCGSSRRAPTSRHWSQSPFVRLADALFQGRLTQFHRSLHRTDQRPRRPPTPLTGRLPRDAGVPTPLLAASSVGPRRRRGPGGLCPVHGVARRRGGPDGNAPPVHRETARGGGPSVEDSAVRGCGALDGALARVLAPHSRGAPQGRRGRPREIPHHGVARADPNHAASRGEGGSTMGPGRPSLRYPIPAGAPVRVRIPLQHTTCPTVYRACIPRRKVSIFRSDPPESDTLVRASDHARSGSRGRT
jgi:hypothetical protein